MKRRTVVIGCSCVGIFLVLLVVLLITRNVLRRGAPYLPSSMAVYQSPSDLQQSVIVPTMDSKLPEGKNVIWCASFQLSWDHLARDVLHAPAVVAHAEEIVSHLNANRFPEDDLPETGYYATAGFCRDGVVDKITEEMQRRFQKVPRIGKIDDPRNVIVAYGYLEAVIPFPIHYFENPAPMLFQDAKGGKTNVLSFGANFSRPSLDYGRLGKQVRVLHCVPDANKKKTVEFVIDPCRESSPNQLILACVPAERTLQATWNSVEKRMAAYPRRPDANESFDLDVLLVPSMAWEITHHFTELEGHDKRLKNKGFEDLFTLCAMQGIRFRLDRGGVEMRSEAFAAASAIPRKFVFDRPFFVFIRKRGSDIPFFAMYVDNAELLEHKSNDVPR
jgi:hypothetical protein